MREGTIPPQVGLNIGFWKDRTENVDEDNDGALDFKERTEPLLQERTQDNVDAQAVGRIDSLIRTYYGKPIREIVGEVTQRIEDIFSSKKQTLSDAECSYIQNLILDQPSVYIAVVFSEYVRQTRGEKKTVVGRQSVEREVNYSDIFPFMKDRENSEDIVLENYFREKVEGFVFVYRNGGCGNQMGLERRLYALVDKKEHQKSIRVVSGKQKSSAYAEYVEWVLDNFPEFVSHVENMYAEKN